MTHRAPRSRRTHRGRDIGMTLPELLIAVTVMGMIMAAISGAIIATMRQGRATEGRINVARSEQSVDTWLPADLASTDVTRTDLPGVSAPANDDPAAELVGNAAGIDTSGTNLLLLSWTTSVAGASKDARVTEVLTQVQYQYIQRGAEWLVERIECVGSAPCSRNVVLHDAAAPPGVFAAELDKPTWVFTVNVPTELPDSTAKLNTNGRRITVTVNGGGAGAGAGGGENRVDLTAGGSVTDDIKASDLNAPSFSRAASRCGGYISIIADTSGSVLNENIMGTVIPGVVALLNAFRGTPTNIQVIGFANKATVLGGSSWHHYVDMTTDDPNNPNDPIDQLITAVLGLKAKGATNWEDALFRAYFNENGTLASQLVQLPRGPVEVSTMPRRVVFFTDGAPTLSRLDTIEYDTPQRSGGWPAVVNGKSLSAADTRKYTAVDSASVYDPAAGQNVTIAPGMGYEVEANGSYFAQQNFDRALWLVREFAGTQGFIGIGVGPDLAEVLSGRGWQYNPATETNRAALPGPQLPYKGIDSIDILAGRGSRGVKAQLGTLPDGTQGYTNPQSATYYDLSGAWNPALFAAALKAATLQDCGGTLTVQTRLVGASGTSTPVADEFVFENPRYFRPDGSLKSDERRLVTTSANFRTGTFDFVHDTDSYFSVEVNPYEINTLRDYHPVGWQCQSAGVNRPVTLVPIPDSGGWSGIKVDVKANEAVSCILQVSK